MTTWNCFALLGFMLVILLLGSFVVEHLPSHKPVDARFVDNRWGPCDFYITEPSELDSVPADSLRDKGVCYQGIGDTVYLDVTPQEFLRLAALTGGRVVGWPDSTSFDSSHVDYP